MDQIDNYLTTVMHHTLTPFNLNQHELNIHNNDTMQTAVEMHGLYTDVNT